MGTADIESPISVNPEKLLQTPSETPEKIKRLKKSSALRTSSAGRDSSSMTPTRSGRSLTPFSLYLIRHSTDPTDPPKWRSITPFLDRKDKEKTPFELGKELKNQLIAHKMVFDRASVMDITDESNYEPARFLTSDSAVIDRASIMDISNVEVVYLIEEYDEGQESAVVDGETQAKEKKKSKRSKKARATDESLEKFDSIGKEVSPGGSVEKKILKAKNKIQKKKKVKNDSDDDDLSPSPPPSLPKLTLKLELGGGQKMNKKMFESKAAQPEAKPPVKKTKEELEQEKAKADSIANAEKQSEQKIKKKKKSITSLGEGDTASIKSGRRRKSKSRKESITSIAKSLTDSITDNSDKSELSNRSENSSLNGEESSQKNFELNLIEETMINPDEVYETIEKISIKSEEIVEKLRTPTPPPPPPRRSPSPAFPAKQPESYYKKISQKYGKQFSDQVRVFNSIKRNKPHHPAFIIKLKDLCVTETDTIRISCATYGSNLSYKWLKDDIILNPNDRVHFLEDENVLTLEILNSRPKDTADYTLKIFNEYKFVECVSYVNVAEMGGYQDEPCPAYIESIEDYFHFVDDKLMIECKVKGIPRPTLRWYKEDMEIHDWMPEYSFMEEPHGRYILIINHPTEQDIGNYTLHVDNDRGTHIRQHCVQFLAKRPTTSSKLSYRAYKFLC